MQCSYCGNHLSSHFQILKTGYICKSCGGYHYYLNDDEQSKCNDAFADIRAYRFFDAEESFREILREYPESVSARWGILLAKFGIVEIKGFYEKEIKPKEDKMFILL